MWTKNEELLIKICTLNDKIQELQVKTKNINKKKLWKRKLKTET